MSNLFAVETCPSGYNEHRTKADLPIDRAMEYCKEHNITYADFQRLEHFGKIPTKDLNHINFRPALKEVIPCQQ